MINFCKYIPSEALQLIHHQPVYEIPNQKIRKISKGDLLIVDLQLAESIELSFFIDNECSNNTKEVKWAFIYDHIYQDIKNDKSKINNMWAPIAKNKFIKSLHIGQNYKIGEKLIIEYLASSYFLGFKQRIVVFEKEEDLNDPFYFYIIPIREPAINYACFKDSNILKKYGETATLELSFHNLPAFKRNDNTKYKCLIYLVDISDCRNLKDFSDYKEKNLWTKPYEFPLILPDYFKESYINVNHNYTFYIDKNWRKNEIGIQEFSILLEVYKEMEDGVISYIYEIFSDNYDRISARNFIISPNKTVNYYDDVQNAIIELPSSSSFKVEWETMSEILEKIEIEKNNKIAAIGELSYSIKEHNSCNYKSITISEKVVKSGENKISTKKNRDFIIFNEDRNIVKDITYNDFEVIAGESSSSAKEIEIIVSEFETSQDLCKSILLSPTQKHNELEYIFNLGDIYTSKLKNNILETWTTPYSALLKNSNYTVSHINYQGHSAEQNPKIDNDYDPKPVDIVEGLNKTYNWKEGTDYSTEWREGQNRKRSAVFTFKQLKYYYNRYIELTSNNFINRELSSLWLTRYICLTEKLAQRYAVPVSSCAYPNQLAKFKVFPDIEWFINIKYNAKNPIYVKNKPNYGVRLKRSEKFHEELDKNKTKKEEETKDATYDFDYEIGCKVSGKPISYDSEKGLPLLNAAMFIMDMLFIIEETLFQKQAKKIEEPIGKGVEEIVVVDPKDPKGKVMNDRYSDRKKSGIPLNINIERPSFSGGMACSFKESEDFPNKVGTSFEVNFAATPLFKINGSLDLLYYAQFIPAIGTPLKAMNAFFDGINFLTLGAIKVDYYLNIAADFAIDLDWTALQYHTIDGFKVAKETNITTTINTWLEAGINIKAKMQGIVDGELGGIIRGEAGFIVKITFDETNKYWDADLTFTGLDIKIWLKANTEINTTIQKTEDESNTKNKKPQKIPPPKPTTVPEHIVNLLRGSQKPWKWNLLD